MWRRNVATIIAGGLLAILLVAYMSTYQVRFNEVAIVKTLGQIRHVQTEPGLRACWPWPIQQVVKYDLRVHVLEDPLSEPLTQGGKPVTAQAYMAWRIKKPELFLTKVGSVSQATSQLKTKLKSQKEAILGSYSLANFVSTDAADLKLGEVENILRENMNAWAEEMFGIEVLSVGIKRLGVPASTSREIFEAMKEGRGELIKEYQSQGQAEATRIISEAKKTSEQIQSFANLRAEQLRAEGQAKAAEQFKEFQKNEAFAIFLKEINMLRQTLQTNTTIVLDWTARPFNFFTEGPSLPAAPASEGVAAAPGAQPGGVVAVATQPASEAHE